MKRPFLKQVVHDIRHWRDGVRLSAEAIDCDAFLVSYPKSGRTWLRFLLSCYFAAAGELGFEPELRTMFRVLPNFDLDPVRGIPSYLATSGHDRVPRIFVSHLGYRESLFLDRPAIFLVRDPRDVMVSAYFHASRHKQQFSGSMDAFLDDEDYGLPALIAYLNGWAEGLLRRPHLLLSYEDMLGNVQGAVCSILDFLNEPVRPELLRAAVAAASFERMRERELEGGIPGHLYDRSDAQSLRMRSGKAKAFGQWLSEAQSAAIVARCGRDLTPGARALVAKTGLELGPAPQQPNLVAG